MRNEQNSDQVFVVVVNNEDQYSIWPEHQIIPLGWRAVGEPGSKETCLKYISEVWTDLRPLSQRRP